MWFGFPITPLVQFQIVDCKSTVIIIRENRIVFYFSAIFK